MSRLFRPALLVPIALVGLIVTGTVVLVPEPKPLVLQGISTSSLNQASLLTAAVSVNTEGSPTTVLVDGVKVAAGSRGTLTASLRGLRDGVHRIVVRVDRGFPRGVAKTEKVVEVDATAPALMVEPVREAVRITAPVVVRGVAEPGAVVSAAGGEVAADSAGFTVRYTAPPAGGAVIVATDPAGNRSEQRVAFRTRYPDNIRAVHVTGRAWQHKGLRDRVMALVRERRINAIQLDIKDEDGVVNYPTNVRLAALAGARAHFYDAAAVTKALHGKGIRVIGRIVAFNDPKLANWAEKHGRRDWLIQNPDGSKYLYGYNKTGFTNFAAQPVRDYNRALAVEAIKAGFDDVIYDYVRRPDGPIEKMRFPGLKGDPEDAIVTFLAETQAAIRPLGGSLGAAAFAQASTRPGATAQNIRKMAKYLDVVIPMNYPSHWNPGEYGVPDPYVGAYEIVKRSLVDWLKQVKGTDCVVVPWLQDENFRGAYTPAKVQEQINGTRANGIPGWLMWSSKARYQAAAYSPDATPAR